MPAVRFSSWSAAALGASAFMAVHYLFLRAASGRIEDRLGALVLEGSAVLGIVASLAVGLRGAEVPTTRAGLGFAMAGGLAVSGVSVLAFAALRRGAPVASMGTIVFGGGVALAALASPWVFGESFTTRRALGVALGLAAMWVLGSES